MKIIIYVILLSLFLNSLSLEFSNLKRKNSVNAYLRATNNLGYRNGYKTLGSDSREDTYFYHLDIEINNKRLIEEYSKMEGKSHNYIKMSNEGFIGNVTSINKIDSLKNFEELNDLKDSIICEGNRLCLNPLQIRSLFHTPEKPDRIAVIYLNNNKKEINFNFVIKNYEETEYASDDQINLIRVEILISQINGLIDDTLAMYKLKANAISKTIDVLKQNLNLRKDFLEKKDLVEKATKIVQENESNYEKCLEDQRINSRFIDSETLRINHLKFLYERSQSKYKSCLIHFGQKKQIYITAKKNFDEEIENVLEKNKKNKEDITNDLEHAFYWIEAAYYYRVFANKVTKSFEDLERITESEDSFKELFGNIAQGFLPSVTDLTFLNKKKF